MMDDNYESLTNDAKFLLLNLYKMYVERRKDSTPKREARLFDSINKVLCLNGLKTTF